MVQDKFASARKWVSKAGELVLASVSGNMQYERKTGHQDLVTSVDRLVEFYFRKRIEEAFPNDVVVGEEYGGALGKNVWYIDPLDGTTNFISQGRNYGISVAYYENHQPVFGLVLDVAAGELYPAMTGEGSFCNDGTIHVSMRSRVEDSILYTPVIQHTFLQEHPYQKRLLDLSQRVRAVRSLGSVALELCALAAGRGELFFAMKSSPWDHNAARIILQEAGGILCLPDGRKAPFDYAGPIVASSRKSCISLLTD